MEILTEMYFDFRILQVVEVGCQAMAGLGFSQYGFAQVVDIHAHALGVCASADGRAAPPVPGIMARLLS